MPTAEAELCPSWRHQQQQSRGADAYSVTSPTSWEMTAAVTACELILAIRYDANFKGKLQIILIWNTKKGTSCLRTQGFPGINRSLIPGMSGITLRLARWRETLPGAPGLLRALGRRSCREKLGLEGLGPSFGRKGGSRRKAEARISGEGAGPCGHPGRALGTTARGSHTSQARGAGSGNSLGHSQGREL